MGTIPIEKEEDIDFGSGWINLTGTALSHYQVTQMCSSLQTLPTTLSSWLGVFVFDRELSRLSLSLTDTFLCC